MSGCFCNQEPNSSVVHSDIWEPLPWETPPVSDREGSILTCLALHCLFLLLSCPGAALVTRWGFFIIIYVSACHVSLAMPVPNPLPTSNGPLETRTFFTNCIHGPPSWGSYPGNVTQLTLLPTGRIIRSHQVMQEKGLHSQAPPLQEFVSSFLEFAAGGRIYSKMKDHLNDATLPPPHTPLAFPGVMKSRKRPRS